MEFDWRGKVILAKLAEGCTVTEAARAAVMTRQGVEWRWGASSEFAAAVAAARETGKEERQYRRRLHHPFRGKRPPTGKGHGGSPRFSHGRR